METFNVQKKVLAIKDAKIKQVFSYFLDKFITKDNQINELQQMVTELESRVTESEKYFSKDCLLFENMAISDVTAPILHQVCDLLKGFLIFYVHLSRFKVCHILGSSLNPAYPPAITVKLLCFNTKWR